MAAKCLKRWNALAEGDESIFGEVQGHDTDLDAWCIV